MAETEHAIASRRLKALVGFGALLAPFYVIVFIGIGFGQSAIEQASYFYDVLLVLIGLLCAFGLLLLIGRRRDMRPDSIRAPWAAAVILALSFGASQTILLYGVEGFGTTIILLRLICACSLAVLLYSWGQKLGTFSIGESVPTAFIGSALAAVSVFLLAVIPWKPISIFLTLFPLLSALMLTLIKSKDDGETKPSVEAAVLAAQPLDTSEAEGDQSMRRSLARARRLTFRLVGGTVLYGGALGLLEAFIAASASARVNTEFLLLALIIFALAAYQLFRTAASPLEALTSTSLLSARPERGPLDGAYRLAVLLLMLGFLLMPLLSFSGSPSASIAICGEMALLAVFMALFLIMGSISGIDAGLAFSRGLFGYFGGVLAGIIIGWIVAEAVEEPLFSLLIVTGAAIAVLMSYLFVFTDRDMTELSIVVEDVDRFDTMVSELGERYKLSPREREVASYALRGRSSERIAQELMITKNTVDTHLRRIYRKCGVHGRQELIDLIDREKQGLAS